MPITCKCGEIHEAVPQAEFDKRLDAMRGQNKALKTELDELGKKYDPKEYDGLLADRAELGRMRAEVEGRDALGAAGFQVSPKAMRLTRALYELAVDGTEEGKRPSYGDWLKDEKGAGAEPTLAPLRVGSAGAQDKGAKPAAPGKQGGKGAEDRRGGLPDPNRGATDPGGGRMSVEQVQAVLNRLPVAERAAKAKELGFDVPVPGAPRGAPEGGGQGMEGQQSPAA